MPTKPATIQTAVRMPADLHAKLTKRANAEERSLNTTIVRALRVYVESKP